MTWAQTVYRIIAPDGSVTFSDTPPVNGAATATLSAPAKSSNNPAAALPFALRPVVSRYPVTLYTSSRCVPCNNGRDLLSRRGIPFTEKTVNTPEDAEALLKLSGETSLPFLTIGAQTVKGFSVVEWTQYLDAAGYPVQSLLPANYPRPTASPLAPVAPPVQTSSPTPADSETKPPPAAPNPPVTPPPTNPARIRF
jgi:glutaredoxin